jgi:threonylcarbamoyladenosine tRNA methylthiotransferase MtaB
MRLAPHLHAPLQSGSDAVLKRMGRHWYTSASYARAVERLIDRYEPFAVGADVITGFPGETAADHAATVRLVESLPFTYLHVFPFSVRPGTSAERLPRRVDSAAADRRARELRALGDRLATVYRAKRSGRECDVVAIGSGPQREGLTEDYLTVGVDSTIPRGARFRGRLEGDASALRAVPL